MLPRHFLLRGNLLDSAVNNTNNNLRGAAPVAPILSTSDVYLPSLQIEEKQIILDASWFSAEREIQRSKGLHLSHVINFIEGRKGDGPDRSDSLNNYACGGFLWERVLDKLIHYTPEELFEMLFTQALFEIPNPKVVRPGEICLDGIYMTPDGYDIEQQCLQEWKYTNKSSNTPITHDKFSRWVQYQIPSYLKALSLTKCILHVYYARGNYTTGEPIWKQHTLIYSQQEIDETWDAIKMNAEYMREHGLVDLQAT